MKIPKSITFKLFVILLLSFFVLTSILLYVQVFVVSRLYLTTEYTKQRKESLSGQLTELNREYLSLHNRRYSINVQRGGKIDENKYSDLILNNSILEILGKFERANRAYVVILDDDYHLKYITEEGRASLRDSHLRSLIHTLKNDLVKGHRNLSFRVRGLFNLPSQYIAVSQPIYLTNYTECEYMVAITPEVYTDQNVMVLKKYVVYIFLVAALLTIVLSGILSYLVTRPVVKINKTASRMIEMDFKERCDIQTDDEIGNLARSLNFLSEKLDATLQQLQQANEKLQNDLDMQRELDLLRRDFIAAVSHEFKTPVTLIRGYTESIKDKVARENERELVLDTIITEVGKIDTLVQDLLDLSSMESSGYRLKEGEFYIDDLLQNIFMKYELLMTNKKVNFKNDIGYQDTLVEGDSYRIEQVVTNFLNNAVANTEVGSSIILLSRKEGNLVYVAVENEGSPIPDEEMNRIWEKFYKADKSRTRKSTGGTGLGLSICKAILDNHGCTYGVENTKCGVRFYFYLKVASGDVS